MKTGLGESLYKEMKVVNDNIYNFIRYEKKYNDSIKEVSKRMSYNWLWL